MAEIIEAEVRERYLAHLNDCDYCRNPCAEGNELLLAYRHAHDPSMETFLLRERVIDAAIARRKIEKREPVVGFDSIELIAAVILEHEACDALLAEMVEK